MKLLAATRSRGKQAEIHRVLSAAGHEVVFPDDAGVPETEAEAMLETADSFEGNARRKAEYFARRTGLPTLADDSGLEVFALGGEPGVRSKRWAGAAGTPAQVDAANNAELRRRLLGAAESKRRARYRCVLVLLRRLDSVPEPFEGVCNGSIVTEPRGTGGFGYDPWFLSDELGRTFAEAAPAEKDAVSHRGRALAALVSALGKALLLVLAVTACADRGATREAPGGPSVVAGRVLTALAERDAAAFVGDLHPEAVAVSRAGVLRVLDNAPTPEQRARALDFFGGISRQELNGLPPDRFLVTYMQAVFQRMAAAGDIEMTNSVLGEVLEGDTLAHVVYRARVIARGDTATDVTVLTLRDSPGGWKALLTGNLRGLAGADPAP